MAFRKQVLDDKRGRAFLSFFFLFLAIFYRFFYLYPFVYFFLQASSCFGILFCLYIISPQERQQSHYHAFRGLPSVREREKTSLRREKQ